MASKVYINDIGTEIVLNLGIDLTAATLIQIKVRKPSGKTVTWTAVLDGGGLIKHVCVAGDLNEAGEYKAQAYVEMPSYEGHSETVSFTVYNHFK